MRRPQIRIALGLLCIGVLVALWVDTEMCLTATERIHNGMTLLEVQIAMRDSGKPGFMMMSGDPEIHRQMWEQYGVPSRRRWEDAATTADVTFRAPHPATPVVVGVVRTPKTKPTVGAIQPWRVVVALFALLGLASTALWTITAPDRR